MTRKLATIREIKEIRSIEGADLIELAIVDGWQCVVAKKDGFKVGQKAIYFEIDSLLPQTPEFEFLKPRGTKTSDDGTVGYRLRTIKLRGELSQGLLLPINNFKNLNERKLNINDDLTQKLNISLYEPPIKLNGLPPTRKRILFNKAYEFTKKYSPALARLIFPIFAKFLFGKTKIKTFPCFIRKTDQERIQNLSGKLEYLSKFTYEKTIKLDGSSMTVYYNKGKTGVCSRNQELDPKEVCKFNEIEQKYDIKNLLIAYGKNIAIQGELIGESIQGNPENLNGNDLYVFDIFDIDKQRYLLPYERLEVLNVLNMGAELPLKHVPILENEYNISNMSVNDILSNAEGKSLFSKNREGVVFKSNELANGHIVHFKAISNKYLLKQQD